MVPDTYDVVIVGGGTAGLILAARLSEDPNLHVAVLESGEDHSSNPHVQTPGMWPLLRNGPLDWAFKSSFPSAGRAKPLSMTQGRMLGGTSGINGFVFQPSSRSNLDFWTELGNSGWGFEAMDRAVRRAVTVHHPSDGTSEGSGPIQLVANESEIEAMWVKTWIDSLAGLGHSPCDAFSGTQRGPITNLDTVDPVSNKRSFTANAYLDPVRSRANLTVLTGCTVNKVVYRDDDAGAPVADGVLATFKGGSKRTVRARKEVILSAGVLNSPRILELSGIGDRARLQRLGIDVVVDNPHVGENFQNHAFSGIVLPVRDDVDTLDAFLRQDPDAVAAAQDTYARGKGGPIGRSSTLSSAQMPLCEVTDEQGMAEIEHLLTGAAAAPAGSSIATPAFKKAWESYIRRSLTSSTESPGRFMFVAAYSPFEADDVSYRAPGNHFTIVVMLSTPFPRGSVHIESSSHQHSDTNTGMALDVGLPAHPLDVDVLARYVMFAEKSLARLEPFASLLKPRTEEDDRFTDIEKAREYVKANTGWSHHFVGTCSMMSREMGGVVDDKLRVYGCSNLRVCDASIIPVVPRSNPQAVVYGLAEHGAEIIKNTLSRGL